MDWFGNAIGEVTSMVMRIVIAIAMLMVMTICHDTGEDMVMIGNDDRYVCAASCGVAVG